MTVLAYIVGVLFLALGVGVSIGLHEIGHLVPAKKFGVRVTQYMVGFGPTIWSRRRGETEYGIKGIPLGGYIRMIGMFPPRPGDDPTKMRVSSTGRFSQLADEARKASLEEIRPGDENRVFYKLPVHKKVIIMLGGPVMNLLIGLVLLTVLVPAHGFPRPQEGALVAAVAECVKPAAEATDTDCTGAQPSPANAAGLLPGDKIISVQGTVVRDNSDVGELVRPRVDQPTKFVIERDGTQRTLTVTPILNTLPAYDEEGQPILGADGKQQVIEAGYLGVSSATPVVLERSVTAVPAIMGDTLAQTAQALVRIPQKMVGVWNAAFSGQERELDSPVSVVGVGRVAGEVTSGRLDAFIGESWSDKFWFLVSLLMSLNFMLFLFNLVPLLPLDGGHVAGALWEGVKKTWARLRGRPDPGYVDVAKALPVAYGVSMVLIVMSALLIYADIVNPIDLGG
ncbi:membrane-associated protease RseP (regulator of RpoE activity) [Knoellia remsis]|uniref:Membrane-associated protease RseP (Regulator of RpoE activity) n=1 Tax=Knoellia remsis TaxID=407159 RepID=A0A2T0UZM4_9MICO|nr:site-2 protease family protein [Knoellia remsis]PRY63354.1 membrane-associated protease RseP (regulator of RpoE activity) [Knoellia remsis]